MASATRARGYTPPPISPWWVYAAGFVPAAWLIASAFTDNLGADPAKTLERELGEWALRFLLAGLAVTPLRRFGGINLLRYRRALGLLAFWYAALHLAAYLVLDQWLDWRAIWADILKRPYITIGMAGFVLLVPLAVTSSNAAIRALGGAAWARMHKLVYLAVAAGALHYVLLVKGWQAEPLIYAAIAAGLLALRLVPKPARAREGRAVAA